MKVLLKILGVGITGILVTLIGAAVVISFSARSSPDHVPTAAGRKILTVLSGSMEPAIQTGDVIIVSPIPAGEVAKEGDVITFRVEKKPDTLVTHRVVGLLNVNGKPTAYVTKGDANNTQDLATVALTSVVGRYQWRVPYFGYVANFVHQPIGMILTVILPGALLIGIEVRKIYKALADSAADKAQAVGSGERG